MRTLGGVPAPSRFPLVPGYVRALGVLTLLMGIAVMHTLVFSTGHAMAAPASMTSGAAHSVASAGHLHGPSAAQSTPADAAPAALSAATVPTPVPQALAGSDCDGCMPHGGMHACVFVLVALALALGLAVIAWIGADRMPAAGHPVRTGRRRDRPPPWTVLSLAELAILRI